MFEWEVLTQVFELVSLYHELGRPGPELDNILLFIILFSFKMNGRGLSLMTMDMFSSRVPCGGKTLFKESAFKRYSSLI